MEVITANPAALIETLEPDQIRYQIAELDRQQRALRVLLRAAVARERKANRSCPAKSATSKENQ
jgi:hypothetical protein